MVGNVVRQTGLTEDSPDFQVDGTLVYGLPRPHMPDAWPPSSSLHQRIIRLDDLLNSRAARSSSQIDPNVPHSRKSDVPSPAVVPGNCNSCMEHHRVGRDTSQTIVHPAPLQTVTKGVPSVCARKRASSPILKRRERSVFNGSLAAEHCPSLNGRHISGGPDFMWA